jgi:glycosyltransferase involved in cell wall biosynthesis
MRILFVNAYFFPEKIAFSHLEKDLIEGLIEAGYDIEVICPTPTRNVSVEVYKHYKSIKSEILYNGKVHVRRFSAPREKNNPLLRAIRYLWCNFREYQIGKHYKNIDAVFAVSTPPTQGLLAGKLSKKLKCPFIYSLQDVFPDSLVTTGLAKKGSLLWYIGSQIERKTYGYAKRIIVISESFRRNLIDKGVPEDKITLIPNWVDTEQIKPIPRKENRLIFEFNIDPNKFLVVYAGNFGAAQGAEIILNVAEKLLNEQKIQFVIFGGGAEFEKAVKYVIDHNLTNVLINPLLSQERVSEVYSLGDIALITCKPGVGNSGMPSKTWSIMACNTTILASFDTDSDLAETLQISGAGICVEAGNVDALAHEIIQISYKNIKKCNLRNYVQNHADRKLCVSLYIEQLTTIVENTKDS